MSFLQAIKDKKKVLAPTRTKVTTPNGIQFVEMGTCVTFLPTRIHGFVIDTKPDKIPVKILDFLYLGSQDAIDINILRDYQIMHILSIGVSIPFLSLETKITTKCLLCLDLPETVLDNILEDAFDFMDTAIRNGRNILVHCNAGVSRSPSIIIAYLIRRRSLSFSFAFAHVKKLRPSIRPNDGFMKQLQLL